MATSINAGNIVEAAPPARRPARRRWLLGATFVMLLLVGLFQTMILIADGDNPILHMDGRSLVASGPLETALRDGFAAQVSNGPQAGERFRNAAGTECRRFAGRPAVEGPIAGTACMVDGEWRIVELRQDVTPARGK